MLNDHVDVAVPVIAAKLHNFVCPDRLALQYILVQSVALGQDEAIVPKAKWISQHPVRFHWRPLTLI